MSSSNSPNNNKNYEYLYNNLKEEYEQSKKDNDEICKEYESTIQLLTDSVESFKKEKKELQLKLSKIENDQKQIKREKDNLIKKNKDKMIDIQCLNEQNDKLNELIKKLKEEKSLFDTKIVTLENDIDHYQNKIREYEDFADELKAQLEDALEENITLQTEFETYKLNTGDQLLKKDEELRDIRSDMITKEKIIQRLNKKPSERFNIQKIQEKMMNDKKIIGRERRFTFAQENRNYKTRNIQKDLAHIEEIENENNKDNKEINNNKVNEADDEDSFEKTYNRIMGNTEYKKHLISCKTSQKNIDSNKYNNYDPLNNNISENKSETNIKKNLNFDKEVKNKKNESNNKKIIEEKNNNKMLNQHENKMNGLNSIICKQFGELVICKENKIYVNPLVQNLFSPEQIKEFTISLQSLLIRVQQRKILLFKHKKEINEKFEKIRYRV